MVNGLRMAAAAALLMLGPAKAASAGALEGNWFTGRGAIAQIAPCGRDFCVTLVTGKHTGRKIGRLRAAGDGSYQGNITDPIDNRAFDSSARVAGDRLSLHECVRVFCREQEWKRR